MRFHLSHPQHQVVVSVGNASSGLSRVIWSFVVLGWRWFNYINQHRALLSVLLVTLYFFFDSVIWVILVEFSCNFIVSNWILSLFPDFFPNITQFLWGKTLLFNEISLQKFNGCRRLFFTSRFSSINVIRRPQKALSISRDPFIRAWIFLDLSKNSKFRRVKCNKLGD